MKLGIEMVLIALLSVGLLTILSGVAIAQTSPQNQTMPVNQTKSTSSVIPVDLNQLRDEVRSQYPVLAAIADQIQTMDARDTLKYTIGVHVVSEMLDLHASQLLHLPLEEHVKPVNQTKSTSSVIPVDLNQLRDEVRSQYPVLAAIADQIQTMDARDTLKYTIGVHVVSEMLDLHARQLLHLPLEEHVKPVNQTNSR